MTPFQPIRGALINAPFSVISTLNHSKLFSLSFGIILILVSFQSYAQNDSWTLLKEESGVKVYYKVAACDSDAVIDPLEWVNGDPAHETFQLKFVNDNNADKSVTFSKVTKTDDSDELETITIPVGNTLLESCTAAPKMMLTKMTGDHLPVSVIDYLSAFTLTVND